LFFELTGYKIDIEGKYEVEEEYGERGRDFEDRVDPGFGLGKVLEEGRVRQS